jgi:hypothetical protein
MRIGELVHLRLHRPRHVGMAMTQARDSGSTGGVDIALAVTIDDVNALAAHRLRQRGSGIAMQNAGHESVFLVVFRRGGQ